MPMDERTKETVRTLLARHPSGYATAEVGFTVTGSATGLFRLLCFAILADRATPSEAAVRATRALLDRGWDAAPAIRETDEREREEFLRNAGHPHPEAAARDLGGAARLVTDRYDGDLNRLRDAAHGDGGRVRALLSEIPGMDDSGLTVFLREVQLLWPEVGPFLGAHAAHAARRLGLPDDARTLLTQVARGEGEEEMAWLAGALALVDARDEYRSVEAAVR
ncbi:hypothetical protein [Actinomadura atramentaria]|uniref:hypothetical protein n=1 Tax=Actinomadura atramentaria TaxID=1990 RepID=UPI00039E18B1|nr:hypothetical protein [Actinomadura atramentaria]